MTENESLVDPSNKKIPYSTRIKYLNEIAKPLATKALTKKIYKLVKKGSYPISQKGMITIYCISEVFIDILIIKQVIGKHFKTVIFYKF